MKTRLLPVILALGAVTHLSRADIGLDDTYEQVIAEKGQPIGRASAGDAVILRYADGSIRLKAGKVVAINLKPAVDSVRAAPAPAAPASKHNPSVETKSAAALAWRTDYRASIAEAKEQHRHIFLFFTGSDWCGWCMRLQREILTTPQFARYAGENLILVELDFPRQKSLPAATKRQNMSLQRVYQIEGYPTVVVLDEDGKEVGRLGYQQGGPEPFVRALQKM